MLISGVQYTDWTFFYTLLHPLHTNSTNHVLLCILITLLITFPLHLLTSTSSTQCFRNNFPFQKWVSFLFTLIHGTTSLSGPKFIPSMSTSAVCILEFLPLH